MPPPSRAETLSGIVEVQDGTFPIDVVEKPVASTGHALRARREKISQFPPLGPSDMLYLRKRYVPVVGSPKHYGYYHFVRGVAPSSVAKVSAYIVDVARNIGLDPQSWVAPGAWEITSATFVTYNTMAHADLVVHVNFPGGTSADAFDRNGNPVEITELFWHELLVSSVLRELKAHDDQHPYPSLRVLPTASSISYEQDFIDSAIKCVRTWHLTGTDSTDVPTVLPSESRVAIIIRDHFINSSRFEGALEFFLDPRILDVDPLCAVHAAMAARYAGDLDRADNITSLVIEKAPKCDIAWMEKVNIMRTRGDLSKALELAKNVMASASSDVWLWSSVADLYVDLKQHANALHCLNRAEMTPPILDPFLHSLLRLHHTETTPIEGAANGTDAVRIYNKRLRDERNVTNDRTDEALSDLPAKLMLDVDHACYGVLVKILNDLSWDNMLAVRGQCFVMETDIENDGTEDEDSSNGSLNGTEPSNSQGEDQPDSGDTINDEATNGLAKVSLADDEVKFNKRAADERKRNLEKSGKKLCKPWLDYLVTNMYHDLRALAIWRGEEHHYATAAALAVAAEAKKSQGELNDISSRGEEADMESQVAEEPAKRTTEDIARTTQRPSADWLRRGELALRLKKLEEARDAFSICVAVSEKEKKVSVTALSRLMKLASKDGDIKTTLRCADRIWSFMDTNADRKSSSDPTPAVGDVRNALFSLISAKGLRAVREVLTDAGADIEKKRIEGLLLDAVAMRVDGFSR